MMLRGISEIFKERPGDPYSPFEKEMTFLGTLPMFFPVSWLLRNHLLLGAYIVAWVFFGLTARSYEFEKGRRSD